MILVKDGVIFKRFLPEIYLKFAVIDAAFTRQGRDCVITAAEDGNHMKGSLHYAGRALDLRSKHLDVKAQQFVMEDLREGLGKDWDVLLESPGLPAEHIHIEYDPK